MVELLISSSKFSISSDTIDFLDVTDKMADEVELHTKFVDIIGMDELISDEYNSSPEQIYELIVDKVYLDKRSENTGFDGYVKLKDSTKWKLLCAFNNFFIKVCEEKLGNRIRVDYI